MNDIVIIANPSAGKKKAEEYAKTAQENFSKHNRTAKILVTRKKEDISNFAIEASEGQYKAIVVMGGDGTVSELANGLMNQNYRPPIGILPTGTVNNIARGLNISTNIDKAISDLLNYRQQKVDVGKVNNRLFLSSVSAGSLPETIWEISDEQKKKYGSAAYFLEGFKSLREEEIYTIDMEIDGVRYEEELSLLLVGVSHSVSGVPHFFNQAKVNDGKLYLLGLKETTVREKIEVFLNLLNEGHAFNENNDTAFILPFEEASIAIKNASAYAAVDGEKGPTFPININVLPEFLTFLVPR